MSQYYEYETGNASEAYNIFRPSKAYRDIDVSMERNPVNNDILTKTGVISIKQSLRNLVLLNHYEKPFNEDLGSDIYKTLFELYEPGMSHRLETKLRRMISTYEPRVEIEAINVSEFPDNNSLDIEIVFKVLDTLHIDKVNIFLQITR